MIIKWIFGSLIMVQRSDHFNLSQGSETSGTRATSGTPHYLKRTILRGLLMTLSVHFPTASYCTQVSAEPRRPKISLCVTPDCKQKRTDFMAAVHILHLLFASMNLISNAY